MQIRLTKYDLEGDFFDVCNCPIGRHLRRNLMADVTVGGLSLMVNRREFVIGTRFDRDVLSKMRRGEIAPVIEIIGLEEIW